MEGNEKLAVSDLRSYLLTQVPEYMVPSHFVELSRLPLTPNGKVDRRALPEPDRTRPELGGSFVAPRTPVEEVLAGIWVDLLQIEKVGVHDDFFELGGHSVLATQLIYRLNKALRVRVALQSLFDRPTVAGIADALLEDPSQGEKAGVVAELLLKVTRLSDDEVDKALARKDS